MRLFTFCQELDEKNTLQYYLPVKFKPVSLV